MKQELITIATFDDYQVALLLQSKLQSSGIRSTIKGYTPYLESPPPNVINLQVRRADLDAAIKLIGGKRDWKRNHGKSIFLEKIKVISSKSKVIFTLSVILLIVTLLVAAYFIGQLLPSAVFIENDNLAIETWMNGFIFMTFIGLLCWVLIWTGVSVRKYMFPKKDKDD